MPRYTSSTREYMSYSHTVLGVEADRAPSEGLGINLEELRASVRRIRERTRRSEERERVPSNITVNASWRAVSQSILDSHYDTDRLNSSLDSPQGLLRYYRSIGRHIIVHHNPKLRHKLKRRE